MGKLAFVLGLLVVDAVGALVVGLVVIRLGKVVRLVVTAANLLDAAAVSLSDAAMERGGPSWLFGVDGFLTAGGFVDWAWFDRALLVGVAVTRVGFVVIVMVLGVVGDGVDVTPLTVVVEDGRDVTVATLSCKIKIVLVWLPGTIEVSRASGVVTNV